MTAPRIDPSWFHRRPFFWWAGMAVGAVFLTYHAPEIVPYWSCLLAACMIPALLRRWVFATFLAIAALFIGLTGRSLDPPRSAAIQPGKQVSLRGVLGMTGAGENQPSLLYVQAALSPNGWAQAWGSVGLYPPDGARAGDAIEVSGVLHRPPPQVNPGGPSARLYWLRRGAAVLLHLRKEGYRTLGRAPSNALQEWAWSVHRGILEVNRRTLSPTAALVANDFLIGDADNPDTALSAEVTDLFRNSGTIHLLVVSGTQVTLVLVPFLWLGWRGYRWRYLWWGAGFLALTVFWLATDGSASVTRAFVIGLVVTLGLALQRETDAENCLGVAALALLALNPLSVFDVGGQLSFVALWSLRQLGGPLSAALGPGEGAKPQHLLRRGHTAVAGALGNSVAAHLATAPLLAFYRGRSVWSGILANLFVFFLAELFTLLALFHTVLSALGLTLLRGPVEWSVAALCGWARFFAQPPFGASDVFPPPVWLVALVLIGLAAPAFLPARRPVPILCAATIALLLLVSERLPAAPPGSATLRAMDVGQGDALLLQGADGSNVLVDAGPTPLRPDHSPVVQALRALRVPALDAVVVSHMHADHMGGLPQVLDGLPVRLLLEDARTGDWTEWSRVRAAAEQRRIPVLHPRPGDRLRIRSSLLTVLGPLRDPRAPVPQDPNDESLVIRWDSGGTRMLLTGDAGAKTEPALLCWGPELRADVLKVGHHGSRTATSTELLTAVRPRVAVLSCGRDNRFGHPAPDTVARIAAAGIPLERTDRSGMVTLRVTPGRIGIERYWRE